MLWFVVPFMLVALCLSVYNMRKGGSGPAVNWVPRRYRQGVNDRYRKHGWALPYDEDGNRNPNRSPF